MTQRRQEIGIRMALGARSADVLGMVIRQGMAIAGAALLLGIPEALAASRLLASHVYGIAPHDPVTFGVAAASYVPGRAATKMEPMSALRLQ